jgi:hypothetical protein
LCLQIGEIWDNWCWRSLTGVPAALSVLDLCQKEGEVDHVPINHTRALCHTRGVRPVFNQAIAIQLLNPFVDDSPRPGVGHVRTEDGRLIVKGTRRIGVATIFRKEDGNGIVYSGGLQLGISRTRVRRRGTAPLVGVQGVEIDSLGGVWSTDEIVFKHGSQDGSISGRVPNRDLTVTFCFLIAFQIGRGSEKVWRRSRVIDCDVSVCDGRQGERLTDVEHLIANEEACRVVVLLEVIDDSMVGVRLSLIPSWFLGLWYVRQRP